ncbi:flagellar biosynthesis protein FlhA [Thalassoglobus neptunius]|uniref:flagellar biosynthesis protein FlhA n=1 Tax=Thalassoglobus neptunius TaxID=1938619 RepID=UPI001E5F3084|nr:flagellar biosynthesis protein FlhA [Thalassoglobus neptunius]
MPLGLMGVLVIMLIPLPPFLLDILLASNLTLTILLLLVTMGARQALDLSVFPSLLLLLTLYRLSLNVATTRVILLSADAGKLVQAFGDFVVGGDLIVGLVIFLILIVIQFVVISKGAGRISEVAARFTLDALPGKQMSIDAELNAGSIDEQTAKKRREELAQETEFYGAMDGASKFVRGDAIAGLIITSINPVGGMLLGITHGMSLTDSLHRYSILTVGDGLISQIPALIIAVTAGILVTKTTSQETLGEEIETQLLRNERPLWIAIAIVSLLTMVPGLPKFPFFMVGLTLVATIFWKNRSNELNPSEETHEDSPSPQESRTEVDDFLMRDRLTIELGSRLISLINSSRGKKLPERITSVRNDFAKERGIWIPPIRVKSQLQLEPNRYHIRLGSRVVASGELQPDSLLAIPPEKTTAKIPGTDTVEPAFQLPAKWIDPSVEAQAKANHFTVVDSSGVLMTHLGEVLKTHGHELLSREVLKEMLDRVREFAPSIVDELKAENARTAVLHQVLRQLAAEGVSLVDLSSILESIANHAAQCKDPNLLTDAVRIDQGQVLCDPFLSETGELRLIAFDPRLEGRLRESMRDGQLALGTQPLNSLIEVVQSNAENSRRLNLPIAIVTDKSLRRSIRRLFQNSLPYLGCLAYQEVPAGVPLDPIRIISLDEVYANLEAQQTADQIRSQEAA